MGRKDKNTTKKPAKQTHVPKARVKKGERKKCKSPRGVKMTKVVNRLIDDVGRPHPRHRNNYNARMAKVAKLAKLL